MTDFKDFIKHFKDIEKMGYVLSVSKGSFGVGRTFENLMGIRGNCNEFPDYNGIEIKTKSSSVYTDITLINCTPIGYVPNEIERLKDKYGYPCRDYKKFKVLFATANCLDKSKVGVFYKFQLKIDKDERKIVLLVFDLKDNLIDDSTFWPLDLIEARFSGKCNTLALVHADRLFEQGNLYFHYNNLKIMELNSFDIFLELLEKGLISVEFKIGIYKTAEKFGVINDHGTAFKINEKDLDKLYNIVYDSTDD